jgi:hypothetical protein
MKILMIFSLFMSFTAFSGEILTTERQDSPARPHYRFASCQMYREGVNFQLRKYFDYCWRDYERHCRVDANGNRYCYETPVTRCNEEFERHVFATPVVFENGLIVVKSSAGDTVIGKHFKKRLSWFTVLDNKVVTAYCDARDAYLDLR